MMEVTTAYAPNPVDLANAYFSGMCYALSRMENVNERDALLDTLAATAKEAVLANADIAKHSHQRKKR
jgi:hypothetical protein